MKLFSGRTEDKTFELLLDSIADYFIDNPLNTWRKELKEAANAASQQIYSY